MEGKIAGKIGRTLAPQPSGSLRNYKLVDLQPVSLAEPTHLKGDQLMSPFVWEQDGAHWMALRVVLAPSIDDKVDSIICFARGDGLHFEMAGQPALRPGTSDEDINGCEDPTLFFHEKECRLYYTGWNAEIRRSRLLYASGDDIASLRKGGDVLTNIDHWNLKEATIAATPDGWCLFYEYSDDDHSLIGRAESMTCDGDWKEVADPFGLRPDRWDSWHLSTGPTAFEDTELPVMFYNGSNGDANWRIGWVEFDRSYKTVLARSEEPIVGTEHLPDGYPDMAFAASALTLDDGKVLLYLSIGDRSLWRATIEVS